MSLAHSQAAKHLKWIISFWIQIQNNSQKQTQQNFHAGKTKTIHFSFFMDSMASNFPLFSISPLPIRADLGNRAGVIPVRRPRQTHGPLRSQGPWAWFNALPSPPWGPQPFYFWNCFIREVQWDNGARASGKPTHAMCVCPALLLAAPSTNRDFGSP